jgi:glycosyltransferase involved in cell wall biosynthesis
MNLVSVIIPMRNAEPFIRAAIESVLAQSGVQLDVIVVDDGSTDRSVEVVRGMNDSRVRIVPGPRSGISDAFNTGLAEARGEFVARCDADDLYPSNRLTDQAKFLAEHADFGAICGYFSTISETGKLVADQNAKQHAEEVTDELRRGVGRSHMCA